MANTMMKHIDRAEHSPDAERRGDTFRVFEAAAVLLTFSALLYAVMRPESGWSGAVASGAAIVAGLVVMSIWPQGTSENAIAVVSSQIVPGPRNIPLPRVSSRKFSELTLH